MRAYLGFFEHVLECLRTRERTTFNSKLTKLLLDLVCQVDILQFFKISNERPSLNPSNFDKAVHIRRQKPDFFTLMTNFPSSHHKILFVFFTQSVRSLYLFISTVFKIIYLILINWALIILLLLFISDHSLHNHLSLAIWTFVAIDVEECSFV